MRTKIIFPIVLIGLLACLYYFTLAPGLSWANGGADGGDLITAVAVNGVPHPTGYPLYLIIAKLFQWLPIGNLAFRTNLLSAICTLWAAFLIYQTILHFKKEDEYGSVSALSAALIFGLSPLVWSQAVITEVYGLQSLLTIGILYQTICSENKPYNDFLRGLLLGLALGNHITTIFLIPLLLGDKEKIHISPMTNLITRFAGLLVGLSIYLILPFRAMDHPAVNWFNPLTFKSFFQLVTGQIYHSYFSTRNLITHAGAYVGLLIKNISIPGVVIGIYSLLDKDNHEWFKLLVAWVFVVYALFALFYESYDSYVYLIQAILAFSLWIGLSFDKLIRYLINQWHNAGWILFPLLLLFFVSRISSTAPKINASNDNRAEIFAQTVFDTVPENALLFTKDDRTTFTLWYFHYVDDMRSDTSIIAEGLLNFDWYRQTLQSNYPTLLIPETPDLAPFHLIYQNPDRPFCFIEYPETTKINCSRYKF